MANSSDDIKKDASARWRLNLIISALQNLHVGGLGFVMGRESGSMTEEPRQSGDNPDHVRSELKSCHERAIHLPGRGAAAPAKAFEEGTNVGRKWQS
jgi:hypothetical protein